ADIAGWSRIGGHACRLAGRLARSLRPGPAAPERDGPLARDVHRADAVSIRPRYRSRSNGPRITSEGRFAPWISARDWSIIKRLSPLSPAALVMSEARCTQFPRSCGAYQRYW